MGGGDLAAADESSGENLNRNIGCACVSFQKMYSCFLSPWGELPFPMGRANLAQLYIVSVRLSSFPPKNLFINLPFFLISHFAQMYGCCLHELGTATTAQIDLVGLLSYRMI